MAKGNDKFDALGGELTPDQKKIVEELQAEIEKVNSLIAKKAWADLASLIDSDTIVFNDFPEKTSNIIALLEESAKGFSNVQFVIREITKAEISSESSRVSGLARLFWDSVNSWEENFIDLSIGLIAARSPSGGWRGQHLSITALPKAATATAQATAAASPAAGYFTDLGATPRSVGGYFAEAAALPERSASKRHLVYVPVILDHDVLSSLLNPEA